MFLRAKLDSAVRAIFAAMLFGNIFTSVNVLAQDLVVSANGNNFSVGERGTVLVTVLNGSNTVIDIAPYLDAQLYQKGRLFPVILKTQEIQPVQAGGFRQVSYYVDIPQDIASGVAELVLSDASLSGGVLLKIERASLQVKTQQSRECVEQCNLDDEGAAKKPGPTALGGLKAYHPIYFIAGFDPTDVKFQISLRYQIFNENSEWFGDKDWLRGFHLGYTQVSFWDLSGESRPFEDTNFMPEIFYSFEGWQPKFLPKGDTVDLQLGLLHESNGRDQLDSRSLNIVYQRLAYKHRFEGEWFAKLTADFWRYVGDISDNPDIADFRGHSSFRLTLGSEDWVQFSAYRRGPIGGGKSSYLFDATMPLTTPNKTKRLNFSLHGQLFTGYGENLLTYDKKETRFRIGLGIYR